MGGRHSAVAGVVTAADLRGTFANRRVFVTGHTGFKGSWLSAWLTLLGAEVTGYALAPERDRDHFHLLGLDRRMRHIEGDIRDAARLEAAVREAAPEFVFHLAAQPLVRRSYVQPRHTFETNVSGSVNLLEAVRETPSVRTLVYVTSDKCYREAATPGGYREGDALGGRDPYSASKACAELVFVSYQASFLAERPGFAAASVRAGNVIGGGDWAEDRIVPDCVRALEAGQPILIRNPQAVRPWQHVLEALGGYLHLAALLAGGRGKEFEGAWNFGPNLESHRNVQDLVRAVIATWGSGSVRYPAFHGQPQPVEAHTLVLNCEKARQQLGWRPRWDFAEAVRQTMLWYRQSADNSKTWDLTAGQIEGYAGAWSNPEALRETA